MKFGAKFQSDRSPVERPPGWFWLLPLGVSLLRTLPYLWLQMGAPPPGQAYLKLGYLPKDFLCYLAFMRQVGDGGAAVFLNPFTTDPQSPRFVLLLHWLLGVVASVTGHLEAVLEFSRIPLAFLFFWALWRFLRPILTERSDRLWACILVAFSGGVESYLQPLIGLMPPIWSDQYHQDTWQLFGWNTFASFFNPLWIAALTCILVTLGPVLRPEGPQGPRDLSQISFGLLTTYLIHPYSAIFVLIVAIVIPAVELLLGAPFVPKKHASVALALCLPLAAIIPLAVWQSQEPIYRQSAATILGPQAAAVFWYPLTFGILGLAALRGAHDAFANQQPFRYALTSWIVAAVWLHTSPLINGYKFLLYLHPALCILAAPVIRRTTQQLPRHGPALKCLATLAAFALFGQGLLLPLQSIREAQAANATPTEYIDITATLAQLPPGNVLAPPDLGNILPAYTPHRVWVGHWFLTPNYEAKAQLYMSLARGEGSPDALLNLLAEQRIRYLVLPLSRARELSALKTKVVNAHVFGKLALLTLGGTGSPQVPAAPSPVPLGQ
ncbi:MAG: hypothetical protein U1G07_10015 [Verrucomicrobiota bacterium]